jgi:hypothetical protein
MKLVILYNKIVIHDIKNNYTIFIYLAITNYITTWCGGWVVKTLDCGQGSEESKHNFDMLSPWHRITNRIHEMQILFILQEYNHKFSIVQFGNVK